LRAQAPAILHPLRDAGVCAGVLTMPYSVSGGRNRHPQSSLAEVHLMQVTDIRIRRVSSEGKLKAYVTVTFDDCFVVHNVKVIEGKSGVFIAMPSRRTKSGEYKDVAHPIHSDFRNDLQDRILRAYNGSGGLEEAPTELVKEQRR